MKAVVLIMTVLACVLRQWIFEPVTKNGQPVAQRALMRVDFKLPEA